MNKRIFSFLIQIHYEKITLITIFTIFYFTTYSKSVVFLRHFMKYENLNMDAASDNLIMFTIMKMYKLMIT